jgi:hypothetical protein
VVEAAAKVAAMDLSRIVIKDPEFGYVSLSNHPATGIATRAEDGEPLPVTGINTLIGTVRQNAIIAEELSNDTMRALVDKDTKALESTMKNLSGELTDAITDSTRKGQCFDINGKAVTPLADVENFLKEHLPADVELESVKLTLGWLDGGAETAVALPQPTNLARVPAADIKLGQYNAFKAYPVGSHSFSFAAVAPQAHLVSQKSFREADSKHFSSIVRIDCKLRSKNAPHEQIECAACCQPFSLPDETTRGGMTLRFAGRPVPGLLSWNEFLSNGQFLDNKITTFDIMGGDFPLDKEARMQESSAEIHTTTSQQFAEHLYFWLRNGRLKPRVDAVLAMINEPFNTYANEVYTYEFADDGSISRKVTDGKRFARSVIADGQVAAMADTRVRSGASAIILFRDNVRCTAADSGKHGGQPLAGYPLTESESPTNHEELLQNFPRRKDFRYGLALDIEIGGTGETHARDDIARMRQRCASRRI